MPVRFPLSSLLVPLARFADGLGSLCPVCRSWDEGGVCTPCLARFAQPVPRCEGCAVELWPGVPRCGACLQSPPPQRCCVAALTYAFPWDGLVQRFKYRDAPELAGFLAGRIAAAVRAAGPSAVDLVVPVPLTPARLRARGYNQSWELARRVASSLGVPAQAAALQRLGEGPTQQGGSREQRRRQVREVFAATPAALSRLTGRRVALVDDVMTTGATAEAAAAALLRAGAAAVDVWVLARTPAALH